MYTEFSQDIDRYIWTSTYEDPKTGDIYFKTMLYRFNTPNNEIETFILLERCHETREAAYQFHDDLAKQILLESGLVHGIPPDDFYDLSFQDILEICCPDNPDFDLAP